MLWLFKCLIFITLLPVLNRERPTNWAESTQTSPLLTDSAYIKQYECRITPRSHFLRGLSLFPPCWLEPARPVDVTGCDHHCSTSPYWSRQLTVTGPLSDTEAWDQQYSRSRALLLLADVSVTEKGGIIKSMSLRTKF